MKKLLNIKKNIKKLPEKLVIGLEKEEPMETSSLLSSHWLRIENRAGEGRAYGILTLLTSHWVTVKSH